MTQNFTPNRKSIRLVHTTQLNTTPGDGHASRTHQWGIGEQQIQIPGCTLPCPRAGPALLKRSINTSTFLGDCRDLG